MDKQAKIYVAGHRGLVGSALIRQLQVQSYTNVVTRTHAELDLTNQVEVYQFFADEKPDYVILAAAKVGGIHANNTYPAEFIQKNLAIQTNVIHESWVTGVKRLLFLGSSCIYPRICPQPIKEEYLLTGELEPTNRPYAIAKITGIEMCWAYNRQYGTQFIAAMPTNCYGPEDNYNLDTSHVIPALIRKFHEAKVNRQSIVIVWGTGTPKREFLYSDDMAKGCMCLLELPTKKLSNLIKNNRPPLINIGSGQDLPIKELAEHIGKVVGYKGEIAFDKTKLDGTPRKLMDSSLLSSLGWKPQITLEKGLELAYESFKGNYAG